MRNLLLFIVRNHFVLMFVLIESFSIFLVVQYNGYQRSCFINSSNNIVGKVNTMFLSVSKYFYLNQKNQELNQELAMLRNQLASSYKADSVDSDTIVDMVYTQQYEYVPCQVISNSIETANNYLTLNIGSKHGIEPGMGVISASGVVGVVKTVSPNFSSVISVLNQNLRVSAMLKGSGFFGSLCWDGAHYQYADIEDLPEHIQINKGDVVMTSGFSTIFPKGIMIGVVDEVIETRTNGFISASVKLAVDFKCVSDVLVIKNLLKNEQVELQNISENE